jgi:adenine-specific DNA-methyltransferase
MTNYEKLINTLTEVFMLDKAELDFGIYRIMNQKRKDIEQFLQKDLVPQVKKVLSESLSIDKQALQKELDDAIKSALALGADPESLPKVQQIKARLGEAADMVGIENEVFSLLANFFKRYYDNGDFISMRRYKKDVYAIPYEGEEVKLHWANADQYYIKTSEYFKVYKFKLSNGKKVSFELIEASTEQNNNKTQDDNERRFSIYAENPCGIIDEEFKIFFIYEPADKKVKQNDLLDEAFEIVKNKVPKDFVELLSLRPTEKDKLRTLLQKHLLDYTARNTFDYFIHKDLGGFLTRELDFYIKNEVLFIDDLNTRDEQEFLKQLSKIKAIKKIGEKIIAFLAQLENFQKKLWLKKKMVVECNYCVTINLVPIELYPEILTNQVQILEWVRLFSIDEIKATPKDKDEKDEVVQVKFDFAIAEPKKAYSPKVGFTSPLSIEFLKQNQFLVLDTAFFNEDFKWKLITSIENFDKQCDGLLINSENFQALNSLIYRFENKIDTLYLDPPYNTAASEIMYKNEFKHSAWISLMYDRLLSTMPYLKRTSIACVTIDDFELNRLQIILDEIFGTNNFLGNTVIRNNPSGRSTVKGFSINHEYGLYYSKYYDNATIGRLPHSESQEDRYDEEDDTTGKKFEWENFRKNGTDSNRSDRPKQYYPIVVNKKTFDLRVPQIIWIADENKWEIEDLIQEDEICVYPNHPNGSEKVWKFGKDRVENNISELLVKNKDGQYHIYRKKYLNEGGSLPRTWWDSPAYSARDNGTRSLTELFGANTVFSFPKSVFAVIDCLKVSNTLADCTVLDYFGGSGTTGHAVINMNREDDGNRKYILVEMGTYFDTVTKPRISKVVYSKDWKDGKPISREGISHCFKYIRLESYEDTLNNLAIKRTESQQQVLELSKGFKEGYMLNYMLDVETQDSLLNLEWFIDPFNCYLDIALNNEIKPTKVDLVETFNYLIGIVVESYAVPKEGYKVVTGKNLAGESILVVWRDCKMHNSIALNTFLQKSKYNPLDSEYDRIYVNGDNNVENLKLGDERWKVVLIEEEFKKRMFEN